MSSSQTAPFSPQDSDLAMALDGPDSPPDTTNQMFSHASASQGCRTNGETKISHGAPGSTWTTKKFSDEYDRALSGLQDGNWDHTKYGDPLLK